MKASYFRFYLQFINYSVQPKAVSETDEAELSQLMAKAVQENAEVSGDEDDEEE